MRARLVRVQGSKTLLPTRPNPLVTRDGPTVPKPQAAFGPSRSARAPNEAFHAACVHIDGAQNRWVWLDACLSNGPCLLRGPIPNPSSCPPTAPGAHQARALGRVPNRPGVVPNRPEVWAIFESPSPTAIESGAKYPHDGSFQGKKSHLHTQADRIVCLSSPDGVVSIGPSRPSRRWWPRSQPPEVEFERVASLSAWASRAE